MDTTSSFGYWIRRQRKALDLTQRTLAENVGCSLAAIKKIEQDERRPSLQIAGRLAEVLGVPAQQRDIFLECARGKRPADQLSLAVVAQAFRPRDPAAHNLPIQLTSFIGRRGEIAEIKQLLSQSRLLTLTGPGGMGKTRLALQVGEELLPSFPDGAWLAEAASLADASLLPQIIAAALGLRERPKVPILDTISEYLRPKKAFLILDNCEHLIEACAELSDHLLHACPGLMIIASSREPLGIAGEIAYRVSPLSLPDQAQLTRQAAVEFEAVQLFVERAAIANPKFQLTDGNAPDVAEICCRLDGIPLAIELAAARLRVFSAGEIAGRLADRFRFLTGESRTAPERHQTLRALIDWSYELLSIDERELFRHLSVFAGGWTVGASQAVCSDLDVPGLLVQLVDKSLVMVDAELQESSTRFHLLETIRQYAAEKLAESGESEQARARHADFYLGFAETADPLLHGPDELKWLARLETEYGNLKAGLEWAMREDILLALRLGSALYVFWNRHGYQVEGRRLLGEILSRLHELPEVDGEPAHQRIVLQANALKAFGSLGFGVGELAGSVRFFEEAIGLARRMGEKYTLAQSLVMLGYAKAFLGDGEGSQRAAEEGLSLARELGETLLLGQALRTMAYAVHANHADPTLVRAYGEESLQLHREAGARWDLAMALFGFGHLAAWQADYAEARARFEACLPIFIELDDRNHSNAAKSELAHLERRAGNFSQARSLYRETLLEWQRLGNRAAAAHELECLAMVATAKEEHQRAARLFGAAEVLRERNALPMTSTERAEYTLEVDDLHQILGEAAFARAWAEGRAMSLEQAMVLALQESDAM
jgi:predicted ATPase/DNA-binding XRE family transcriptional regulator